MFSRSKDLTHFQKDLYIKDLCYRHYTQSILLPLKIFLFAPQLVQSGEDIVTYTTACSDLVAPLDMFKVITTHSLSECGFQVRKTYQAPAHIWGLPR